MQQASQQVAWSMADGERSDARASLSVVASMVLLGMSFLLLIAAPVVAERMHLLAARALPAEALQRWVPTAAGAGLALGGGSALVFVLSRLVRDMERRPYACLAPALGVFCGALLLGLRAKLPLPGIASEHVAVFALALAVLGGAFVQERPLVHRLLGLSLTLFPTLTLVSAVWGLSEHAQLGAALWSLPSAARVYLVLLGVSSSAMALLGLATGLARGASSQTAPGAEAPCGGTVPSMLVDARVMAREDTLELSLREDERLLRRRFVPGWVLVMMPVAVLLGVALSAFQAQQTARMDRVHDLPERTLITAQDVGTRPGADSDAPTVESLALPAAPEGAPVGPGAEPPRQPEASPQTAAALEPVERAAVAAITLPTSVLEVPRQATARAPHKRAANLPEGSAGAEGAKALVAGGAGPLAAGDEAETEGAAVVDTGRTQALPAATPPSAAAVPQALAKRSKPKHKASSRGRGLTAPANKAASASLAAATQPVKAAPAAKAAPASAAEDRPEPVKAAPVAKAAPAAAAEDDSLEALMDRAVDSVKGQKGRQNVEDDPIFGL